jgi:hypothetical protein
MVPVRWVPDTVDEVELRGRRIVLRGQALQVASFTTVSVPALS